MSLEARGGVRTRDINLGFISIQLVLKATELEEINRRRRYREERKPRNILASRETSTGNGITSGEERNLRQGSIRKTRKHIKEWSTGPNDADRWKRAG